MKVTISVGGRFHAFYLAQQLLKKGYLHQLITSYPKFEVAKYGIPKEKVSSVIIKEVMGRAWERMPFYLKNFYNPQYLIHEIYDKWASHLYKKSDICVGFSSFALHTIRKAKQMGVITILERASPHILYQMEVLKEEYRKFGIKPKLAHPKIIAKELIEYNEADYISIPSLFVKQTFLERGFPERKLIHVPYGVDIESFRKIPKEDKIFRIIHCGGVSFYKGVQYLLQAFYELNLANAELWLIGSVEEELKPLLKRYDNGKVFCKGIFSQKQLYKYYSMGSVFVLASIQEGLAMVIPQAMSCGLPVIITTNTGGDDLVGNGKEGFIIPIRNVQALKEKILFLYDNPEKLHEMGEAALIKIRSSFTWDNYGDKLIYHYERILTGKQ